MTVPVSYQTTMPYACELGCDARCVMSAPQLHGVGPDWRPAPPEPFALATDAPSAPPLRVRTLDALPIPLVRRTPAQALTDALDAMTAAYRGEGFPASSLDDVGEQDGPEG